MRDLFDDFMEELKRRQAAVEGRSPSGRPGRPASDDDGAGSNGDASDDADADAERDATEPTEAEEAADAAEPTSDHGDDAATDADADDADDTEGQQPAGPTPLRRAGGQGGAGGRRPPRRAGPGGPSDGAPSLRSRLRGAGLAAIIIILFAIITLAGASLDLWTDAIWFRSVHLDAVFWTRIAVPAVLFAGSLVVVLVFLLANLWLAGRLAPPADPSRPSSLGSLAARLGEAFGAEGRDATGSNWPYGRSDQRPGRGDSRSGRGGPSGPRTITFEPDDLPDLAPLARWVLIGLAVIIALATAAGIASQWETVLLWQNQVSFAAVGTPVNDPVFGRDASFYMFQLPFLRMLQSNVDGLLIAGLVLGAGRYLVAAMRGGMSVTTQMRVHLAVLGGLFLLVTAAGYQLDKLELVYSGQGGSFVGVSFTDANARFLAFDVLTAISAFAAAFLVGGAFTRMMWPLSAVVIVWLSASVVLGSVYPAVIQTLSVVPDQLGKETPYIANNIAMTRTSFSIGSSWGTPIDYGGEAPLTASAVASEADTFNNARLWDYRPLQDTLDQLQTVRQYYIFTDVDTDRYTIQGSLRQVMLSARELAPQQLDPQSATWVNQRITFTHGIGVAMVPVNQATEGGQPQLIVRDMPPVSSNGAPPITQPRIYFGERPSDWILTDARQDEFDYPVGSTTATGATASDKTTRWTGSSGIKLDTTMARLLFALKFKDLNLLISDQVTADTQLLFHRSLSERLGLIAPFLQFDKDPYLVITADGRLVYIQDAYTTSDRFPNAQPFDPSTLPGTSGLTGAPFNYIRNSVKIVMDAYTGDMTFYVSDKTDPIIATYEKIFPTLFTPIDKMPLDLQKHLRVPEEQFNVQTRTYARYHVTDPSAFYNNSDLWTVPAASQGSQSLPNEAYYVVMRMPGEPKPEFLLLQPMVPSTRPNMIAWVAARMDAPNYGDVRVYRFPQNTSVLGPNQIAAKIDSDPIISSQTTLWDQSGSTVIRGNLIVVPVQDSLIYLQPVYLQSANSKFPEFQRIIVATSQRIVWGNTLSEALNLLLAGGPGPSPTPGPGGSPAPTSGPSASATAAPTQGPGVSPTPGASLPSNVAALVAYASAHYDAAQAALRAGDLATYGAEMKLVGAALSQLNALVPSSASPAP